MNLQRYIGKKIKIHANINGQSINYTAFILEADDDKVLFKDKFDVEVMIAAENIESVEVVV